MQNKIQQAVKGLETLDEIRDALLAYFGEANFKKLGYAPGMISSEGPEHIERNRKRLQEITRELEAKKGFPIFCASDVLNAEVIQILHKSLLVEDFLKFWRDILGSGYITDIFMTPGWEKSVGARDEHKIAQSLNLKIFYLDFGEKA